MPAAYALYVLALQPFTISIIPIGSTFESEDVDIPWHFPIILSHSLDELRGEFDVIVLDIIRKIVPPGPYAIGK